MKWRNGSHAHGIEVYVVFTDLFMLLFLVVTMMIGETLPKAHASKQDSAKSGQSETVLSFYVDADGALFMKQGPTTRVEEGEIPPLLQQQKTQRVILHAPAALPLGLYSQLQSRLLQLGATEISYIPDGGHTANE